MSIYKNLIQILSVRQRNQGVVLLLQMVISTVLEIVGISLVVPVIAVMTRPDLLDRVPIVHRCIKMLGNPDQTHLVIGSMLILIACYLIKTLFMSYMVWKQSKFAYEIMASLSSQLFESYMYQPWRFHLQHNSAKLIQNIMSNTSIFVTNALLPGMLLLSEGLVLLGVTVFLLLIQPIGTAIIVAIVSALGWLYHSLIRKRISSWGFARQYHVGLCFQHLQQGLGGVKDAKLLGRETEFIVQFNVHNVLTARYNQRQQTIMELPRLWLELFAVIGLGILVFAMVAKGKALETLVPTLGLFAAAAFRIMPSMNRILGALQSLRYGLPVINSLSDEIQNIGKRILLDTKRSLLFFKHEISLSGVSVCYEGSERNALTDINLNIPHGASVGIIGASGAGKSTLVDIILGLLAPDSGEVKVDGIDIRTNIRSYQNQIGYVPQTIYLTDDTLRRNVAFGLSDELIDDMAVKRAIKAAQLEDFIDILPRGMNTTVGERGVRLSGGQRQRIGIARALYHDPAILVLDEATSALDTSTEKEVMDAVNALHRQKTLIIIAHRLSTVAFCDILYRLDQGQVVEKGSFELVTKSWLQETKQSCVDKDEMYV